MPSTMRAVVQDELGGPEVLRVAELERPEPGPTEVLVRVRAAGTNPVDWKTRATGGLRGAKPPFTIGWDVSGTVEAVGYGVRRFSVGDEVYGMPRFPHLAGGYGEYVTAPSRHFDRKPDRLTHIEAAALPLAGLTAYQSLVDVAGIGRGQRVLVHAAAGGVGHLAVQIAKSEGSYVIGTASAPKHDFLRSIGIDEAIDYRSIDFSEAVADLDVVFNTVGPEYNAPSAAVLADGGSLVSLMPCEVPEEHQDRITYGPMLVEPDHAGLEAISALVETGSLAPTVSATFPLDEAAEAHRALEAGSTTGKIVLTLD